MTPACAACVTQGGRPVAADIREDDLPGRGRTKQRLEAHADERREIAAGHLRGGRNGAEFGRQLRVPCPLCHRRNPGGERAVRLDVHRLAVRGLGAGVVLLLLEDFTNLHERDGIARVEIRRAPEMVERNLDIPVLPFEQAELPMQERAVGGGLQRALVTGASLGATAGGRGRPRLGNHVLEIAEAQDLDAPREIGERAVHGERGFERRQRLVVASEGEQRLAASDQRGHVLRRRAEGGVERAHGAVVLLARQRHVAGAGLRRIERGRPLQRRRKLPIGAAEIAVLQESPAGIDPFRPGSTPQFLWHGRKHEIGVARHRWDRWHRARGAGAGQEEQSHDDCQSCLTPHRSPLPLPASSAAR